METPLVYNDIEDIRYNPKTGIWTPKRIGYGLNPAEVRNIPNTSPYQIKLYEWPQENIPSTTHITLTSTGVELIEVPITQNLASGQYCVNYDPLGAGIIEFHPDQKNLEVSIQYYGLGHIFQKLSLDTRVPASGNTTIAGNKTFSGNIYADGNIGLTGDIDLLKLTANLLSINGSMKIDDNGNIGIDSDTDLLQLISDSLVINGSLKINDSAYIGIDSDTDLLQLISQTLVVNGDIRINTDFYIGCDDNVFLMKLGQDKLTINCAVDRGGNSAWLYEKVVNIGDWNMDTTATINVAHGLGASYTKIRSIRVVIRPDSDALAPYAGKIYTDGCIIYDSSSDTMQLRILSITATDVNINRLELGQFDNNNFNETSYNRGWIFITYSY